MGILQQGPEASPTITAPQSSPAAHAVHALPAAPAMVVVDPAELLGEAWSLPKVAQKSPRQSLGAGSRGGAPPKPAPPAAAAPAFPAVPALGAAAAAAPTAETAGAAVVAEEAAAEGPKEVPRATASPGAW
jgi:hypothetical protein